MHWSTVCCLIFSYGFCKALFHQQPILSLTSTGNGKIRGQQLPGSVPGFRLPVSIPLHLLPRDTGDQQAHRHRSKEHHAQDDRRTLQVQLRQEAVQSDTGKDYVSQRGRRDHPQPPLANQEASHPEKNSACTILIELFWPNQYPSQFALRCTYP